MYLFISRDPWPPRLPSSNPQKNSRKNKDPEPIPGKRAETRNPDWTRLEALVLEQVP